MMTQRLGAELVAGGGRGRAVEVEETQAIDLGRALRILLASSWILILIVGAAAGGVYSWSAGKPKVYRGTALVRAFDPSLPSLSSGAARVDSVREVDIQVLYAQSAEVMTDFRARLGDAATEVSSTSVSAVRTADAVAIVVESSTPELAQDGASTYAQAYIDRQRAALARRLGGQATSLRAQANEVQAQLAELDRQIVELQPTGGSKVVLQNGRPVVLPETQQLRNLSTQRNALAEKSSALLNQAGQTDVESSNRQADVDFVQRPALSREPVAPLPERDAAIAALAALFVGLGIVVLRARLRERVTTTDDLKAAVPEIHLVTAIPPNRSGLRRRRPATVDLLTSNNGRLAESYRTLRAGLRLANPPGTPLVLLITSARAGEGKTAVTANLGVSLAQAGERVLVIDCDLRKPNLHDLFDLPNKVGFSSVVTESSVFLKAVQNVTFAGGSLDVLTAGPATTNPAELLLSQKSMSLFREVESRYDYVVVDSPPVLPVADALTLSRSVDLVLLTAGAGRTRTPALRQACQLLRQFDAPLQGAVLVGARHEGTSGGYHDYPASSDLERHRTGKRQVRSRPPVARLKPSARWDISPGTRIWLWPLRSGLKRHR